MGRDRAPRVVAARSRNASQRKQVRRGGRRERSTKAPGRAARVGRDPSRTAGSPGEPLPVVYIVDDEAGTRDALRYLLGSLGLRTEGFDSPRAFVDRYVPGTAGCLILDLRFPEMSGFDLLEHMRAQEIELPVLILTGFATVPLTVRAMHAGALEVIEKPCDDQTLLELVQRAFAIDRDRRRERFEWQEAQDRIDCLTPREQQVAAGVVSGKSSKAIAADLSVSEKTVETHRRRVMEKTRVGSIPELVRIWDLCRKRAKK